MKRILILLVSKFVDILGLLLTPIAASISLLQTKIGAHRLPISFAIWDRFGVAPVRYHYYQPVLNPKHLPDGTWTRQEPLLGIDMRVDIQLDLLNKFNYEQELLGFPTTPRADDLGYYYDNEAFCSGDGEILYSMVRHFRPKRIIEIGSGFSTRMAKAALDRNRANGDTPKHVCIEPFEMPWLEKLGGTEIIRSLIEEVDLTIFDQLEENDILFIDSSHVLRIGGDVYTEYLKILPRLRKGVLIHVHDIFFPFDYPKNFLERRYFWTEQYLLQAFLAFNRDFEVTLALNYLATNCRGPLEKACPVFAKQTDRTPGSFWMRRV